MRPIRRSLCIVGNMLGRTPGFITTQGQIVADLFSSDGYTVFSCSSKQNRILRLLDIIQTIVRTRKTTDILILEVYSGLSMVIADCVGFVSKCFHIPTVFVLHGGNLPAFARRHPRWVRRVLGRSDNLIAPSRFLAEEMRKIGFRARVIPNVVDLERYTFRMRQQLRPRLIWMRAFHLIYNPHMAIRAFANVKKTFPKATLVMAGVDKGLEFEIRQLVGDMGLTDAVRFPGFLDENAKLKEFGNADIYLNTNRIDNMPVAVLEARAMGLPVVATEVGGLAYLVDNRENGMLVPDDNDGAMAEAVCTLLTDPDLAERISKNGRALAEHSSWNTVRECWERLFDEMLRPGHDADGVTRRASAI